MKAGNSPHVILVTGTSHHPDEVGKLCLFLSSEKAGFIAGIPFVMDGGRSAIMQDEDDE